MIYRKEIVRGTFYNSSKHDLLSQIKTLFLNTEYGPGKLSPNTHDKNNMIGCIVPHAGYNFSGACAAHAYFELSKQVVPETIILLGPNHHGYGVDVGVFPKGEWITPLQNFKVDAEGAELLMHISSDFQEDEISHSREHSIEVQLPMLDFIYDGKNPMIIPISMNYAFSDYANTKRVAQALFKFYKESGKKLLFIASSDFSHVGPSYGYMPYALAGKQLNDKIKVEDLKLINTIEKLQVKKYFKILKEQGLTVCGKGAIGTLLHLFNMMKSKKVKGELLRQYTSADMRNYYEEVKHYDNYDNIVDYASIIFKTRQ